MCEPFTKVWSGLWSCASKGQHLGHILIKYSSQLLSFSAGGPFLLCWWCFSVSNQTESIPSTKETLCIQDLILSVMIHIWRHRWETTDGPTNQQLCFSTHLPFHHYRLRQLHSLMQTKPWFDPDAPKADPTRRLFQTVVFCTTRPRVCICHTCDVLLSPPSSPQPHCVLMKRIWLAVHRVWLAH